MDFSNKVDLKPENRNIVKIDGFQSDDAEDDLQMNPGDKLCEDELTVIFSNSWISPRDLLNFRLVSKNWRDAATIILLRRDACFVELYGDSNQDPPCFYKNRREKKKHGNKLSQLTKLISNSKKFPSTNFRIRTSPDTFTPYTHFPDLMHFFKLHWDKIKTFHLQNFGSNNTTCRDLNHLLLSSPFNVCDIRNVTLQTLQMILAEEKGHLIRSFKYKFYNDNMNSASDATMKKFLALNPTLSKVNLDLEDEYPSPPFKFITSVNGFIQSLKDTVQHLSISFTCVQYELTWKQLLSIPPMKKLKSLTLTITEKTQDWSVCECDERGLCTWCAVGIATDIYVRGAVFQFEDGISAENYFPSLTEVSLNSNQLSRYPDVSLINFFSFKSDTNGSSANWNCLPKVDILSITAIYLKAGHRLKRAFQSLAKAPLISQAFPNIRILKLRCGKESNLSGALWALFPNVEFIEIDGIRSFSSDLRMSHDVDQFFTGFADQMLENLKRSAAELSCEEDDDLERVKYVPSRPSICDLRHLKELKLKLVEKWPTEFASSVTGLHAFSKMPNTKFTISYDPETVLGLSEGEGGNDDGRNKIIENPKKGNNCKETGDDEIAKYEELVFGAIKPYVHIVHEKQNDDVEWWNS